MGRLGTLLRTVGSRIRSTITAEALPADSRAEPSALRGALAVRMSLGLLVVVGVLWAATRPDAPGEPSAESVGAAPSAQDELPKACMDPNPYFATACYVRGETFDHEPAIVAFHDDPDERNHFPLATIGEVGAVWGMAYDPVRDVLYAAAFHKRNSKFGPLGPGGIYAVDVNGGGVTELLTVPNAGNDRHDPENDYQPDDRGRGYTTETSLGDIDITEDGSELFVVNLNDKRVYRFSLPDGQLIGSFEHGAKDKFWQRDARPFGLMVRDGWVYHGVVNSARRGQNLTNLWAYVYASKPTGSGMREVASTWLGHPRQGNHRDWQPWPEDDDQWWRQSQYPHPILTDIELTDSGDMILGIRDRFIDTGPSLSDVFRRAAGDIILARKVGEREWEVEDLATEEHYDQDTTVIPGRNNDWSELGVGGLARVRALDVVVSSAVSPFRGYSDGAVWFDNADGSDVGREELLYNRLQHEGPQGKAQGLGDVELICYTPPEPSPTPTDLPTPTPTATPTASNTPRASATPSVTPTPRMYEIYLPYGEDECIPEKRFVDVVLVLDRSTSMLRSVEPGGVQKNEAAIAAARTFIDTLALEPDSNDPYLRHDQVSIVGFNDNAWIEIPLTNDRAAAENALETIRTKTQEGTRLDLAILEGRKPLDGPERELANDAIVVLLTDGLPNRVPFGAESTQPACTSQECTVQAAADAVKDKGTNLYAIALGRPNDIHPLLMLQVASQRHQYYYAPRPEDLAGIYQIILDTFTFCGRKNVPPPTPCVPQYQHADLILVLDTSTSMQRTTRAGRTKLAAALEAAGTFADSLSLERDGYGRQDRLAIVGFNNTAWTELTLSDDRARIDQALAALPAKSAEGTRLDLALQQGIAAWNDSWRLPANRPVLVLLTDGLPNRVPFGPGSTSPACPDQECTVLAAATAAKRAGARVFTIGLGLPDDVLRRLLEESASSPRDYAFAPDAEDLAAIYRQIAGRVRACP